MAQLIFNRVGRIEGIDHDATLLARSLGADSVVTTLWARPEAAALVTATTTQEGWAIFPETRTTGPVAITAHVWTPQSQHSVALDACFATFPHVARFADTGEILVVGSRCRLSGGVADKNAYLYAPNGTLIRQGVLGDGISHIQIDGQGKIWVGYGDEGIYGNFGWGEGRAPIGAPGIVCFDRDFEVTWTMPRSSDYSIDDCYALTTDGADVYACTYVDFPILRIRAGAVKTFRTMGTSINSLLIRDGKVAAFGAAERNTPRDYVVDLADGRREALMTRIRDEAVGALANVATNGDTALAIRERDVFLARLATA